MTSLVETEHVQPLRPARAFPLRTGRPRLASPWAAWGGVVVTMVGFGLIAIAWAKTAGTLVVGRQLPYLVSAGFSGLALVVCGLVIVAVVLRHLDSAEQNRHLRSIDESLSALVALLDEERET